MPLDGEVLRDQSGRGGATERYTDEHAREKRNKKKERKKNTHRNTPTNPSPDRSCSVFVGFAVKKWKEI